jgi:two-component system, cell cycle sensor histidine kinase PleC
LRPHTKWIIGVTAAFAVALGGMFFWMSWHSRQTVITDTFASSSNLALSVEQFVARTMETVDLSLRIAVEEINRGPAWTPREMQTLLSHGVRQSPQITGLILIGPDGHVRSSSPPLPKSASDLSGAKFFTLARNSNDIRFILGEALFPTAQQRQMIFASRRINAPDGSFGGVIAATVSSDYLQRFFTTLHVGEHGIIALETIDGTMLVRQPYLDDIVGQNFASNALVKEWLPWASSGVFPTRSQADGRWRIVGYQRVEKLPLVVQVALAEDEALVPWRRITILQAAVGTVILALSGLTAFLLDRQLEARMRAHAQLTSTVRELERARIAAEESSRVKSQFMANMSHELRTPLNAVIGYSEILLEDADANGAKKEQVADLRRINSAGQRLLGLINDVLDVSEIEVGRLELREGPIDLAKVIDQCHRSIAERAKAVGLSLEIDLAPDLPVLLADEARMRQIVLNLLSNAVKFTPEGGRVVLSAAVTTEGGVKLSIADDGIGMRPEEIPTALEPFRQIDASINRRREGTGLGLPLARILTELHGGTLTITSTPGQGTTVTVTLPADRVIRRAA